MMQTEIYNTRNPKDHFAIIVNDVFNDQRLSYRALGILTYILSKPTGWRVNAYELSRGQGREGRDATRTALRELEACGYLVRERYRDPDTGRFVTRQSISSTPGDHDGFPAQGTTSTNTTTPQVAPSADSQHRTSSDGKSGPLISTGVSTGVTTGEKTTGSVAPSENRLQTAREASQAGDDTTVDATPDNAGTSSIEDDGNILVDDPDVLAKPSRPRFRDLPAPKGGNQVMEKYNELAMTKTAYQVIHRYVEWTGGGVPTSERVKIARAVEDCEASGCSVEQIERGMIAWHESDSWSVSQLPAFIRKATSYARVGGKRSTADQRVSDALELADDIAKNGL